MITWGVKTFFNQVQITVIRAINLLNLQKYESIAHMLSFKCAEKTLSGCTRLINNAREYNKQLLVTGEGQRLRAPDDRQKIAKIFWIWFEYFTPSFDPFDWV